MSTASPTELTPVERPNGKLYRPRKPPAAVVVPDHHDDPHWIYVVRTHDVERARALAQLLAAREQLDLLHSSPPVKEWVRDGMFAGERAYVWDKERGCPCVIFTVDL